MNNIVFKKARLKLTLWYLVILMIVSTIFSVVVYTSLNAELLRNARREEQKIIAEKLDFTLPVPLPDPNNLPKALVNPPLSGEIEKAYLNSRNNLIIEILIANLIVLGISVSAGYLLAGKTLTPIEEVLNNQKKFISNASHELRTPLTALKTSIEVTLKMGPVPYPKIKALLESNLEDVVGLEKLSNSLLRIEKLGDGFDNKKLVVIKFDDVVKHVIERFKPIATQNKIRISSEIHNVNILGDVESLDELTSVLLDNAIKFNKLNGKVKISLYKNGKTAFLKVADTGIGIQKSELPHIFERFYRGETNVDGNGLGLSIASEIVKKYNGQIAINSVPEKGASLIVSLPIRT